MTLFLPAEKEGHVEEGGEVGEELEGEHLDREALLRGSKRPCFLCSTDMSGLSGGQELTFLTDGGSNMGKTTLTLHRPQHGANPVLLALCNTKENNWPSIPLRQRLSLNLLLLLCLV